MTFVEKAVITDLVKKYQGWSIYRRSDNLLTAYDADRNPVRHPDGNTEYFATVSDAELAIRYENWLRG